jgi:protein-tyrosine phosphatase
MGGRSSGVEHNLAKVGVEGSNPFARSIYLPNHHQGARMTLADHPDASPTAPRALGLEGGHNLRDLGGYHTRSGQRLKWGVLYRSGAISNLTESGQAELRARGIKAICDFRTPHERARVPMNWQGQEVGYHVSERGFSVGSLQSYIAQGGHPQGAMLAAMHDIYRNLPFEQETSYRQLFHLLAQGRVPLLFNCSAGKDRTGLAAALILTVLDVPFETIEHDYTLTNQAIDGLEQMMLADPGYASLSALARDEYMPLLDAHPEYLRLAFEAIEAKHGSVGAYLHDALGVGAVEQASIRALLLED